MTRDSERINSATELFPQWKGRASGNSSEAQAETPSRATELGEDRDEGDTPTQDIMGW